MVMALASTDWLMAAGWRQGLFMHCISDDAPTPLPFNIVADPDCYPARDVGKSHCLRTMENAIIPYTHQKIETCGIIVITPLGYLQTMSFFYLAIIAQFLTYSPKFYFGDHYNDVENLFYPLIYNFFLKLVYLILPLFLLVI